jgi:hypothetical protein
VLVDVCAHRGGSSSLPGTEPKPAGRRFRGGLFADFPGGYDGS